MSDDKYIFIIDTDGYAGNFERDMTSYVTGIIGECGVGDDFVELYKKETGDEDCEKFSELLEQRSDDRGCSRPCSLWPTKGWLYDGKHGAVREEDFNQEEANKAHRLITAEHFQEQLESIKKYDTTDPRYIKAGWTEESKAENIKQTQKDIDRCLSDKTVCHRMPPNNSVAIFFYDKPTKEIIKFMKDRANKFAEAKRSLSDSSWDKNFKLNIVGFRLLKETTAFVECEI